MTELKCTFYYTTRNILWQYGYSVVYLALLAIALGVPLLVAFGVTSMEVAKISVAGTSKEVVTLSLTNAFLITFALYALVLCYYVQKKALHKVFFKPYKRFELKPKISRITPKMVFLYFAISLPVCVITYLVNKMMFPQLDVNFGLDGSIGKVLMLTTFVDMPITYLCALIINRYFVHRYADIVLDKNEKNDAEEHTAKNL